MEHPTVELERRIAGIRSEINNYLDMIRRMEENIQSIQIIIDGINKQRTSVKEDETTE